MVNYKKYQKINIIAIKIDIKVIIFIIMSETFVNQVTLDCLLNRELLDSHLKSKMCKSANKKDKKFYRKRIYTLVKDLLIEKDVSNNSNVNSHISPDVKYAFDNFVKTCITHFKNTDTCDIIQSDYQNIEESILIGNNIPELNDDHLTKEEADKLLIRSIKLPTNNTLDHFVKKKTTNKKNMILPKQKNIDLKDPSLKMKGVIGKDKKKNLHNKYEETNNKEKEKPSEPSK